MEWPMGFADAFHEVAALMLGLSSAHSRSGWASARRRLYRGRSGYLEAIAGRHDPAASRPPTWLTWTGSGRGPGVVVIDGLRFVEPPG
jgi:hypothetical protein